MRTPRTAPLLLALAVLACGGAPPAPTAPPFQPTSFTVKVSGAGRPVIFIPGLTCDGSIWDATVAHLGGKVQAHVLSLAGFAGNPPIADPLVPTVREELVRYIRANRLERPIVVGHSLGGFLAFWVAETAPELIGGVVAVDGAPFFPALSDPTATPEVARGRLHAFHDQLASADPPTFAAGMTQFIGNMITSPEDAAKVAAIGGRSDPRTTADAMLFLFGTDLRPDLGKIAAPVLVVAAGTSGATPRDALEKAWRAQIEAVPRKELIVVDHAKHFVMLDQPAALYAALDKFLAAK
jgi:pimeloyl-ACP methyl ester carboxylesterase